MTIGVLALQGDFQKHQQAVERSGHTYQAVKTADDLRKCKKLIIPGGESTTFLHLIETMNLRNALLDFGRHKSIMGTCAGLILLGRTNDKLPFDTLHLIDIDVSRNAYGRQVDSFVDKVRINLNGSETDFEGVFIRAPKIVSAGKSVKILGHFKNDIVMARCENILVTTFHPELTDDIRIHEYFINSVG